MFLAERLDIQLEAHRTDTNASQDAAKHWHLSQEGWYTCTHKQPFLALHAQHF